MYPSHATFPQSVKSRHNFSKKLVIDSLLAPPLLYSIISCITKLQVWQKIWSESFLSGIFVIFLTAWVRVWGAFFAVFNVWTPWEIICGISVKAKIYWLV